MTDEKDMSADERAALEISLPTAMELCRLGLATMIDIRQSFEIEMKGGIPDTVHIPMFEVKLMLGHTLTEDEQDILDAGEPKDTGRAKLLQDDQPAAPRARPPLAVHLQQRPAQPDRCIAAAFARLPQSLVGRWWLPGLEETGGHARTGDASRRLIPVGAIKTPSFAILFVASGVHPTLGIA
jgi:hypothetical protein